MGRVNVKFFGAAIDAANRQTQTDVIASNVQELMNVLAENFGDAFKKKVLDSRGWPQAFVNLFVNNKDIRYLNELETPLNDGDEVLILPAVAGG